jgi:TolB protein
VDSSPLSATGTIAYARGSELRTIEPDGTGDRLVWRAPDVTGAPSLAYRVTGPAWRPDGGELAFSSDHEMAFSPFESDIYAVRPDGKALRKLTNGPTRERQRTFAKGTVTVKVSNPNLESGPFTILVLGADPQSDVIAPFTTKTFTFTDVADLGADPQPVGAAYFGFRWIGGAAADVQPGRTVDAGTLTLSGEVEGLGKSGPFWRGDGSRVGYFTTPCLLESTAAVPAPGHRFEPLVHPEAFGATCGATWGPSAGTASQLLLADVRGDGTVDVLRAPEGAATKPAPVATVRGFFTPDLYWTPDGGGFYVVTQEGVVEPTQIYEHRFGAGTTPLTRVDLGFDWIRRFSVSPDGLRIVFERTDNPSELSATRTDLWIMDRGGANARLLVADARFPAWNPAR